MKWTSTLPGRTKRSITIFATLIAITLLSIKSYAQNRIYATQQTSTGNYVSATGCGLLGLGGCNEATVDNAANATSSDNTFARVKSRAGLAAGLGSYQGEIELRFGSTLTAGTTSYIRINSSNPDLLNTLLGGNLGNVLTNVVGSVALGNRYFEVGARMGAGSVNNVTSGNSSNPFATEVIKVIKDANGYFYVAITPTAAYDRVYLKDFTNAVLGLGANSYTDVYYAFYGSGTDPCAQAFATSYEGTGLTVDLLGLGKAGVTDMERVIDSDPNNFSQISLGALGVAGTISQEVYFETLSRPGDEFNVKILTSPALLNASLLNNITLRAYNGATLVYTEQVSNLLNADLLGLLSSGQPAALPFSPGQPFDRVKITLSSLLNASLTQTFNLYAIARSAGRPTFTAPASNTVPICSGATAALSATTLPANELRWYDVATGGTVLATVPATGVFTTPALTANKTYYVAARTIGCTEESLRVPVNVVVTQIPSAPTLAAPAPVCSGSAAVLSVSAAVPGNTYRWYADAVGGIPLFTGTTYTTGALTANTTFYVESATGTCVSTTRTPVSVIVNPLPNLAVSSTNNETISSGQSATLAASTDAGNTISWYSTATGGTPLATGTTFTTPALTSTTTYYIETRNASGCVSATRVPVTVTVTSTPVNPACNAAVAQQSGITGLLCVACSIQDAGNSTDANANNFTRINLAVGVGAVGYQRLIFASPGSSTDSIRLDLETPTGLADLGVLGGITVRVLNGTNQVASYPLNSSLLQLGLLSGNRFRVTLPAGGVYDRVEVRFGGTATALSSLNIYGAEIIYPNPTIASTGLEACSGSASTLSATANGGTTLQWFANPTGGTALATGETYTTGALTSTTTYYIQVSKGGCANVTRVPVTVTVNPAIVFASAPLSNATVAAAYSKQLGPATGGTPGFTYALAPGSTLPAGLSLSPAGVIGGTPTSVQNATFSVIATDSKGCSVPASFTLNVTPALGLPSATLPNGVVGTPYPVQTIPAATGGTTPYTYVASNLPPGLTFNPATREITGTPTQIGTYVIPVTATDANGNTISRDYTIIVRDPLVLPAATLADGTVGTVYQTQTIPSATGGNGPYLYASTGTLPPGLSFNPATHEITGTPTQVGTFSFPIRVTDADGNTVTTNYSIKVSDPLVLAAKVLADGTVGTVYPTETIPAATGGTGPYTYAGSNLPPGLTFNATTRQITGTPTQSGTFNVSVKATDAVGASITQNYALKVNGVLSLPMATLPNGLVGTTYPAQTLPAVSGGTAPYTYVATGLPPGLSFDPASRQISGTPTTGGTYNITLKATDNAGLSTSTDYALVVNVAAPVVANATTCSGTSVVLQVSNTLPGVTYNWYATSGNTVIFTGSAYTTPVLTANTTYYVEAVSGTAVSSRTAVNVTINAPATLATIITNNETISAGQTATLQASADAGNTIRWYAAASGGAALATGPSFTTPALNANTTYYVETQNANGCISSSRVPVTVTVTTVPANPNCNVAVAQQSGIDGLCVLCSVQTPGGSTDSDPNTFTRINLAVGVGSTGYQRLIFANAGAGTDSIRLDLATPVGLADLGVLANVTVTVMNGNTVVATYPLNSPLLDLKLLSGNRFKATVPAGGAYDRVEIRFGALVSAISNLNIYGAEIIYPNPTIAATGQSICSGSSTTLNAVANGGTTLRWYASPTSGTVLASGETFTTGTLTTTTTYYIEVSKGNCSNAQRVPVTVTVTTTPASPVAAAVAPVCAGSTTTLSVNNPQTGLVYNWYADATGGTPLATGINFITPALTANTTYYVEAAAGTCLSASRTAVAVNVSPLPANAVVSTTNETISSGQTATLSASSVDGATLNWYAAPAGGTILASGANFTTPVLTATTTYYVEAVNASGCPSATRVPVTVVVIGGPVNPNCNAAIGQQSGVEGICLLCSVQDAGNSVDDNLTNYTTISIPVGVGGSGYQRLIFNAAGTATDSVRLNLETPTGLADVAVLGGIQVRIMNGNTVVSTYTLNSSLLNLRLLSGNQFAATFVAGGVYDRVEVRALGLVSALVNLRIYGAEVIYPNPTVATAGQTICSGSAANLSAAAMGGTTLRWYAAATGGAPLATGENFTTPVLTATTTYYIEVSKGSCANQLRVPVTVTVTTAPAAPVVAAVPPVCSGSSAAIPVSNPDPSATYTWYAAAVGGTPLFSGPVFTTPALTANTTYYVEAANGACSNGSRTAVPVTVNPLPVLPQVQASATTVNAGQTVILTGTSTETNVTFNWYTSATSNIPVYTGPTYVTPPLTATTTYYLSVTSNATGCASASRVQVTINVNGGGSPNPVPCEAATSETNGVTGLAVLAGVFNPQLAIDNDTQTGSSLVMPIGLLGASVYQRVGFSTLSTVGDTVRVLLTSPGKLLSLGLLSEIRVSTYNGATANNDGSAINNTAVRLELLSGDTQALISFVPTSAFDQVQVSLNDGLAGLLKTVDINYVQRVAVAPQVASANITACETATPTLSVLNPNLTSGITYKWYDATGNFLADGVNFTTPPLTSNTRYFVEANTASGCSSYRTAVNVTVTPIPAVPQLLATDIKACAGTSVVLTVGNPQPGLTYTFKSGATILQSGSLSTYTVASVGASTQYTVSAQNSCGATSGDAIATVEVGAPTPPVITPAATTINAGERAMLTATSTTLGATFTWYDSDPALGGANIVSSAANGENGSFLSPVLIATTTYYVTSTAGACTSAAAPVTVTVNPAGTPEDVPCEAATAEENAVSGISLFAGVDNAANVYDNNINSGSTLRIPVGIGSYVYQRAIFNGPSTAGDKVKLRLVSPGKLLSLALLQSVEVTTYNGATSNGDTRVLNNPLLNLQLLSAGTEAILEFTPTAVFDRVEVRLNSGLLGALTSINFNYAQRIIAPPSVSAANASVCEGSSVTLAVQNPIASGITYKWYRGTTYLADGPTIATATNLAAGSYDYFVSANRNGCESVRTKVVLTVLAAPQAPVADAANPAATCPNVPVTLRVNAVAGVNFNWYDVAVGGNPIAVNTSSYTTPANLGVGAHDFYVEASNGNACLSTAARTKITITVNPTAVASDITVAGGTGPLCIGSTVTLTATSTTITNPVFTWYNDAALTSVAFTGDQFVTPALTGTKTYYVTVSGLGKCANLPADAKVVSLSVNPPATAADLNVTGAENPVCAGTSAVLKAITTTVINPVFTWYTDAALTNAVFQGDTYTTPALTGSTTYYVTVKGDNKCENLAGDAEVVSILVNPPALAADINVTGAELPLCASNTATLVASSSTVVNPVFTWYSDAALTTPVSSSATFITPPLSVTTTYYVTVRGLNKCENTAATAKAVTLTVNPPALPSDINVAGANTPICAGTAANLTASSVNVINPVFTWYSDAGLTNAIASGPNFNTGILSSTATFYVTVRGANRCENTAANARVVVVTVNPPAVATDIDVAGADAPLCAGSAASLTASSTTVVNPIFTWYSDAALTTPVFTGSVFNTPPITATTNYYVTVRGANKCENSMATAKVVNLVVNPPAIASDIVIAGADPVCAGASVTLNASSTTVTSPVFTWYTDAALTNAVFTGPAYTTPLLSTTTTYYVTVRGANKCPNTAATARVVTITVNPLPDSPVVSSTGTNICSGEATVLTVQNAQNGVIYQWYDAAIGGVALATGTQFTTGVLNATTDFYVMAVSASGCGNPTGRVRVRVTVSPKPLVPTVNSTALSICNGSATILSVTNPQVGVTYSWYTTAAGGTAVGTGTNFATQPITATTIYYVGASTETCSSNGRTAVTVTPTALPLPPASVSGAAAPLCSGSGVVLSVDNPDATLTYRWYTMAVGGTAIATGSSFTTPALSANATYYVETSNTTTSCTSATRTAVAVTVLSKLDAPVVAIQSVTATSITFQWAAVTGASGYEVSLDNGMTWISPTGGSTGTTYLAAGLQPGQKVTIRVRAVGQLACQLSDATTFTGQSENPLGNAVFVPNTFTPNNDGKNDVFYVYGTTIAKMKLRVYNQWGQFLYESVSIQNGWDGTYKGEMQPNGVYVYYLDVEFNDGTKSMKKGTITLLR